MELILSFPLSTIPRDLVGSFCPSRVLSQLPRTLESFVCVRMGTHIALLSPFPVGLIGGVALVWDSGKVTAPGRSELGGVLAGQPGLCT